MFRKLILLISSLFIATTAYSQTPVTVTGTVQTSTGAVATSGYVEFAITPTSSSIIYYIPGTTIVAPQVARCGINSSGLIKNTALTGACTVWGNDLIQPANTLYSAKIAPGGVVSTNVQKLLIVGSAFNLNNPTFGAVVNVVPQYATITTSPIYVNLVPAAASVYTVGTAARPYAAGYFDNLIFTQPLGVSSGGTGRATFTAGDLLVGAGGSALTSVTVPTCGDSSHALSYAAGAFGCQSLAGGPGGTVTSVTGSGSLINVSPTTGAVIVSSNPITEALITTADNTTLNFGTSKHGFVPKSPGGTTTFLRADGTFATPPGGGGGGCPCPITDITGDGMAPGAPSALSANAAFRSIVLDWTNSASADLKSTEVWRATVNDRSMATKITDVAVPGIVYADTPLPSGATYYYWIRHLDYDALNSTYYPSSSTGGVTATTLSLTITETEITNNSISTPKLQALSITADKIVGGTITGDKIAAATIVGGNIAASTITASNISVSTLSSLSANIGTVTSGSITGTTIKTGATGARIELDPTNGLRAYADNTTLAAVIGVSGGTAGVIQTNTIQGLSTNGPTIYNSTGTESVTIGGGVVTLGAASLGKFQVSSTTARFFSVNGVFTDGYGIQNLTGNASIALPSSAVQMYVNGGLRATLAPTQFTLGDGTIPAAAMAHFGSDTLGVVNISVANATAGTGPVWQCERSRGTHASPADLQDGDSLCTFNFRPYVGGYVTGASWLQLLVDGTPTSGQRPGTRLNLRTTDTGGNPQTGIRIKNNADVCISFGGALHLLSISGSNIVDAGAC